MQVADIVIALVLVTIWGSNFVVIKLGLLGLPPILFTALRFLFAALPLVFFVKRPAIAWPLLIGYAFFQFALQFTLLFSGMQLGFPPGLASLVIQLQAFFTIGLAVLLLAERPQVWQLLGAVIALGGMVLVATQLDAEPTVIGFLCVIGASICWAIANILTKKMGRVDPLELVVWAALLAVVPLLAASLAVEGVAAWSAAASHLTWLTVGAVLFQSYPNTIFGFAIWAVLMKKYPTATIAPFTLLVPVTGMLSAALILGEPLPWWKLTAAGMVIGGLAMNLVAVRWFGRRPKIDPVLAD